MSLRGAKLNVCSGRPWTTTSPNARVLSRSFPKRQPLFFCILIRSTFESILTFTTRGALMGVLFRTLSVVGWWRRLNQYGAYSSSFSAFSHGEIVFSGGMLCNGCSLYQRQPRLTWLQNPFQPSWSALWKTMFGFICVDLIVIDKRIKDVFQSGSGGRGEGLWLSQTSRRHHRFWRKRFVILTFRIPDIHCCCMHVSWRWIKVLCYSSSPVGTKGITHGLKCIFISFLTPFRHNCSLWFYKGNNTRNNLSLTQLKKIPFKGGFKGV